MAHAAQAAGVNRSTLWRAVQTDSAFAEEWADAMEEGIDRAEAEGFRRGVVGYDEPVIDRGQLAYQMRRKVDENGNVTFEPLLDERGQPVPLTVKRHSDKLLALILQGRRKDVYATRTELTAADGAPLRMDDPQERAARVAALLALAKEREASAEPGSRFA